MFLPLYQCFVTSDYRAETQVTKCTQRLTKHDLLCIDSEGVFCVCVHGTGQKTCCQPSY